jgi:mono/diheme cytochrome c family protein
VQHQWSGIITGILLLIACFIKKFQRQLIWISAISLTVTGHWGGELTHGSGYLNKIFGAATTELVQEQTEIQSSADTTVALSPTANETEKYSPYQTTIAPILKANCYSCHSSLKKKGGLRLDNEQWIKAGGKNGLILVHGNPGKSTIYTHLRLPLEDEKHMPPAEKNQPSKEEIALIESWIQGGAKESGTLAAAGISKNQIERFILKNEIPFYPTLALAPLAADSLAGLKEAGLFAEAVESGSGLLKVSCINLPSFQDSDWKLLESVKSRIAYLDLSGTQVTDAVVEQLAALPNLTVLKLNSTGIAGNSLKKLATLNNLKLLYLNQTGVNLSQLQALSSSKSLQKVFAFDTPASLELATSGKATFPFVLEAGSYFLPKLATDSIVY